MVFPFQYSLVYTVSTESPRCGEAICCTIHKLNRNHQQLTSALKLFNPLLNIFELRVTIRMTRAFRSFLIALKAITQIVEQRCHCLMSDLIALCLKGCG